MDCPICHYQFPGDGHDDLLGVAESEIGTAQRLSFDCPEIRPTLPSEIRVSMRSSWQFARFNSVLDLRRTENGPTPERVLARGLL